MTGMREVQSSPAGPPHPPTPCARQVWDPTHPTVGIPGMRHYLADLNTAFPDFWVEVSWEDEWT